MTSSVCPHYRTTMPGEENYQVLRYATQVPTTGGCVVARWQLTHHGCHGYSIFHSVWYDAVQVYKRAASPSIPSTASHHPILTHHPHSFVLFQPFSIATPSITYSTLPFIYLQDVLSRICPHYGPPPGSALLPRHTGTSVSLPLTMNSRPTIIPCSGLY